MIDIWIDRYICLCLFVRKKRKLTLSLSNPFLPLHSLFFFFRLDYASRQMVPVCWLFSIHFLSSQTATLPPLLSHSPPPPLTPTPPSNGSSVMWLEIIFYCPVVRK